MYSYRYPRPAVTADTAVFGRVRDLWSILLIERKHEPFLGAWALPGGFVEIDEDLEDAARRELEEETGLQVDELTQLGAYGSPGRDPRGRVITVVYVAVVEAEVVPVTAGSDAAAVRWFPLARLPRLAFDHAHIVVQADQLAQRLSSF